jgi:hypothetical protein
VPGKSGAFDDLNELIAFGEQIQDMQDSCAEGYWHHIELAQEHLEHARKYKEMYFSSKHILETPTEDESDDIDYIE